MKLSVLALILLAACLLAVPARLERDFVFHDRGLERIVDLPGRGGLLEAGRPQPATLASVRRGGRHYTEVKTWRQYPCQSA